MQATHHRLLPASANTKHKHFHAHTISKIKRRMQTIKLALKNAPFCRA